MDDPRWLRVITVGLVLAALAVGYYIVTGAFSIKKATPQTQINKTVQDNSNPTLLPSENNTPSVELSPKPSSQPKATSAYDRIIARNQAQIQTLPKTGIPVGLIVLLSTSVMTVGLGLRKFPH